MTRKINVDMIEGLEEVTEGRSVLSLMPVAVAAAILAGTNTTDVTSYLQSAADAGGSWILPGAGPYLITEPVILTQSNTVFTGIGLPEVSLNDLDVPAFVIGAKTAVDAANRPTGVRITGIHFVQQATQVDITTSQNDWGTVDRYKTAAGVFIARTVDDGDADIHIRDCKFTNWPIAISSYPDCDDETAGTANGLYVEDCEFKTCNFGLWDAGFSEIFFRRNVCRDTQEIQISSATLLPPHMFYAIGRGTPWGNRTRIVVEDCWDLDNPYSNSVKIKGCDEVIIRNLTTASCAEAIHLLKVDNFEIDGVFHPTTPDTGVTSAGAIWLTGCTKGVVRNVDLVQDDDHILILLDELDDAFYGVDGVTGDIACDDITFENVKLEIATGAVGSPVRNEGSTNIRFVQPVIVRSADVDAYLFYNDNSLGNGTMWIYEPIVIAGSGNLHGHKIAFAEAGTTNTLSLDHTRLVNIGRHTAAITSGSGTNTVRWLGPVGITESDADTLSFDYDDLRVNSDAGGRITIRAAAGADSATPVPMGFRVEDTRDGSGWSATEPWGVYDFYSADTTSGSARVRARMGAVATGGTHGDTYLKFEADASGTLTEVAQMHPVLGLRVPLAYTNTSASAANVFVDSDGDFMRSTSSAKYKTDVTPVPLETSAAIINGLQPIRYRSLGQKDNPDWTWYGFLAEDVAEVDPRLVLWKGDDPDGIFYERIIPHLVNVIRQQDKRLAALEGRGAGPPPDDIASLIEPGEAHGDAQARLMTLYNGLTNRLVDDRLPPLSDAERALQQRLHRHLDWLRCGPVEVL